MTLPFVQRNENQEMLEFVVNDQSIHVLKITSKLYLMFSFWSN